MIGVLGGRFDRIAVGRGFIHPACIFQGFRTFQRSCDRTTRVWWGTVLGFRDIGKENGGDVWGFVFVGRSVRKSFFDWLSQCDKVGQTG